LSRFPSRSLKDGELVGGEPIDCANAGRAVREAERLSRLNAGAVAFSRSGDPNLGEFNDANIIKQFSESPPEFSEIAITETNDNEHQATSVDCIKIISCGARYESEHR
jgi:hypothetical protein